MNAAFEEMERRIALERAEKSNSREIAIAQMQELFTRVVVGRVFDPTKVLIKRNAENQQHLYTYSHEDVYMQHCGYITRDNDHSYYIANRAVSIDGETVFNDVYRR